jgi:2-phosphosulfolactate phosphatase
MSSFTDQSAYAIRFEWGERGLESIWPGSRMIVIVDVLSFSTAVDVATARGAVVYPYPWRDESAARFAAERGAVLADAHRSAIGYSLAPSSLTTIPAGTRLVLPSPNGATLSLRAAETGAVVVAACLRNAAAVARYCVSLGGPISVIACGERWPDGTLRPAWEDLVGAGAVIARLPGPRSPEAAGACAAFEQARTEPAERLRACASGRELIERGFADDVETAAALDASAIAPILADGVFVAHA